MSIAVTLQRAIEIGEIIAGEGPLSMAVEIYSPARAQLSPTPIVFFCMPGGGLNSRYFNLEVEGSTRFSFAQQMAARGCITVTINHLGIGASSRPSDGFALTPEVMVTANSRVVTFIQQALQQGTLSDDLPALPALRSIGVGHSMGAMLTIMLQAERRSYSAIAVLGFSTRGLPEYLTPADAGLVDNPVAARAQLAEFVRARSADPYPDLNTRGQAREIYGGHADRQALDALRLARDKVLAMMGFFAMLPGSTSDICAQVEVPVFLGVGDQDMTGPAHVLPASFSGSSDVTLLVLPDTGHTHFIFPSCDQLYKRLADWAFSIASHAA
jgi:pimeloyl-ACP methyl ester carboxylesterase